MLRQKIMCDGDVGVLTFNWVDVREDPWPNFNTWHKCRNFEGIVDWGLEHSLPLDLFLKRPVGDVGLGTPP